MSKKFLVPIDLNQLEFQNATLQNLASAPASPVKGQVYFNTTINKAMVYNGSTWIPWEADTNSVTGVKGSSESSYRTGNVNITAANIGLGNVTDGAEVNQNAFSNVKVGSTTVAADTKTDTIEFVAGSNVTLTPDATNDKVTIAATDTTYSAGTQAQLEAGTDTANRVWQPKIIHDYVASAAGAADAMRFKGTIGTGGDITSLPTSGVKVGDTYRVITAGTYAGQTCEIGDLIIATATTPTWTVAQTNIDGAITNISGTAPVSVTGSGASRTISVSDFTGATATKNGISGLVPAPMSDSTAEKFVLASSGDWRELGFDVVGSINGGVEFDFNIGNATISDTLSNATTTSNGAMSSADKEKLDGITAGAEPNRTYTSVTGKPTGNLTPGFGSSFTISQISQSTTGQITATDRTIKIPNATATTSAAGLMSANDKDKLDATPYVYQFSEAIKAGQTSVAIDMSDLDPTPDAIKSVTAIQMATSGSFPVVVDWTYISSTSVMTASIAQAITDDILVNVLVILSI